MSYTQNFRGGIAQRTAIQTVLNHGRYLNGPEVAEFEKRMAEYVGTQFAIACSSGTDALVLALRAMGVKRGDRIITTPFTFMATVEAIIMAGAEPVFVDIDPVTFNIDMDQVHKVMSKIPIAGVITVNVFGMMPDYKSLALAVQSAGTTDTFVIEDAAQSMGSSYDGMMSGSIGDVGCTSFYPTKPLGGFGDGGMCFTNGPNSAAIMRSLTVHGQENHAYNHLRIGMTARMDTIQAAILLEQLNAFEKQLELRRLVAEYYDYCLNGNIVIKPTVPEGTESSWAQYSVLALTAEDRGRIMGKLTWAGIPTSIYYPTPLHLQPALLDLRYHEGDFPVCESVSKRVFSLPMHTLLTYDDQDRVAEMIEEAL